MSQCTGVLQPGGVLSTRRSSIMSALSRFRFACLATLALFAVACDSGPAPEAADLVLCGGKIITVDDANPEVQALAARESTA